MALACSPFIRQLFLLSSSNLLYVQKHYRGSARPNNGASSIRRERGDAREVVPDMHHRAADTKNKSPVAAAEATIASPRWSLTTPRVQFSNVWAGDESYCYNEDKHEEEEEEEEEEGGNGDPKKAEVSLVHVARSMIW